MGAWVLVSHSLKGHGKLEIIHTRSTDAWHTFILWDKTKYPLMVNKRLVVSGVGGPLQKLFKILLDTDEKSMKRIWKVPWLTANLTKTRKRLGKKLALTVSPSSSLEFASFPLWLCRDRASLGMSTPGKEKNNDNGPCMSERGRPGEEEWHQGTVCVLQY